MKTILSSLLKSAAVAAGLAVMAAGNASAVEINYWQYFFPQRVQAMDELIKQFEAANPGITVKQTHFPYAQYQTKVAAAVPAGQGPDVIQFYYGWLRDYMKAGYLAPLPTDVFDPAKINKEFFPIVQSMEVDGKYYGVPTAVRTLALFYNKDLFKKAGLDPNAPPKTYEEMVKDAKAIVKRDSAGNLLVAGITADPVSQDAHWWREIFIRQFGGQAYSDDGSKVTYDSPAGLKALQAYTDLFKKDKVTDYGFMNTAQAAFSSGRAGMSVDGSFRVGSYSGVKGLNWGVAPIPSLNGVKSNYASYWVNGITSTTKGEKRAAAIKFLQFVTSKKAMQLWLDVVGELPARPDVALTAKNKANPLYGPFIAGLAYAHATKFVNESEQRQIWLDMIDRTNIGGMSDKESLAEAAKAEQALIDKYYK